MLFVRDSNEVVIIKFIWNVLSQALMLMKCYIYYITLVRYYKLSRHALPLLSFIISYMLTGARCLFCFLTFGIWSTNVPRDLLIWVHYSSFIFHLFVLAIAALFPQIFSQHLFSGYSALVFLTAFGILAIRLTQWSHRNSITLLLWYFCLLFLCKMHQYFLLS